MQGRHRAVGDEGGGSHYGLLEALVGTAGQGER